MFESESFLYARTPRAHWARWYQRRHRCTRSDWSHWKPGKCWSYWPQWTQRTTLSFDSFDVSLLWRHIDKFRQEPDDIANGNGPAFSGVSPVTGQTVNYGVIKAYDYFDFSTRVSVLENLSLTFTAQNLGNRKPPSVGTGIGSTTYGSGNTFPSTYDALGRRYAVTARVKF